MVQIAVCDDQPKELEHITGLLKEYAGLRPGFALSARVFPSGVKLLERLREGETFPVYLLDVMMPEVDGLGLGEVIRKDDHEAVIVYLTSSPDYAVASYGVQASGYLLKPVEGEALFPLLDRLLEKRLQEEGRILTVKTRERVLSLRWADIRFVEGDNHTTLFHLSDGRAAAVPRRGSFEEAVAPLLADERFLPVGSSFVVNMLYVDSLEGDCFLMRQGGRVPIPRLKRPEIRERFLDFTLKRGLEP